MEGFFEYDEELQDLILNELEYSPKDKNYLIKED